MAVAGAAGLGDGEPATDARLFVPRWIAIDTDGTLYVTDTGHNRVRKIDTDGIITTFAGTGEQGDGGDDGPAVEAQLNRPYGLTIGPEGHVYIADSFNNVVRKVDPVTGIITHVAGTGEKAPFEDEDAIGDGGPATSARLRGPIALDFDADGNLYITDVLNHRIRRIDTHGIITTFAGSGERSFSGDEGPAAEAQLSLPVGLKIDVDGNFYITDRYFDRNRIRMIDTRGNYHDDSRNGLLRGPDGGAGRQRLHHGAGRWTGAQAEPVGPADDRRRLGDGPVTAAMAVPPLTPSSTGLRGSKLMTTAVSTLSTRTTTGFAN